MCRGGVRKAKTHLEFNLMRDVKDNKKAFCKHINRKRQTRENLAPLLNGAGAMVTKYMEKAEVVNAFFASVVTCKTSTQEPQALETRMEVWSKEDLHSVEENQVREQLNWKCKSMRSDRMHPQVLGKMN